MSKIKMEELTAFEVSMAESAVGLSTELLAKPGAPKLGLMGALAWVHRKREEPTLTFDAYMKSVTSSQVYDYFDDVDDEAAEVDEDGFPDSEPGPVDGDAEAEPAGAAGEDEGAILPEDGHSAE